MGVEVKCNSISGKKPGFLDYDFVSPGNFQEISSLGKGIKIAVICNVDNNKGRVLIKDPMRKVKVFRTNLGNHEKIETSSSDEIAEIEIVNGQNISIFTSGKNRQLVRLSLNKFHNQINPQITEPRPIEPNLIAS